MSLYNRNQKVHHFPTLVATYVHIKSTLRRTPFSPEEIEAINNGGVDRIAKAAAPKKK
jgi:hypothetical protein